MKQLDSILVGMGVIGFTVVGLIISFYIASIILPIVLSILLVSLLVSWGRALYSHKKGAAFSVGRKCAQKRENSQIIDAEYEIIDDGKYKS